MPLSPGAVSLFLRTMSPARQSAPAVLHLLQRLTLLLLCSPAVRGDCSLPPNIPNAQPSLGGLTSFPEQKIITYKCNEGFVKVPGKPDSVVCLKNSKWSEVAEFCNRSCDVPTKLPFASLKKLYSKQNYFPAGSTVEYECRVAYDRDNSLSGNLTCLQNFTWSKPAEFCKKKSCPEPGKIKNGHVNITTDILFGSPIYFSCDTGYKLVGATSSFCSNVRKKIEWSDPLPECKEIICPEPPEIDNGKIKGKKQNYVYGQSVTYKCTEGFTLMGKDSIQCIEKDDQGEWSGLPPTCKADLPATEPSLTTQKPTAANLPASEPPPAPQKPTSASASATNVPATVQNSLVSNTVPTKTSSAAQNPIKANTSAAQTTPRTQRSSTAKASFIQRRPTTQRSTVTRVPGSKGLQTTQTSAPMTATRGVAVPRATTHFHARSTSKGRGTLPSSGAMVLASGLIAGTVITGTIILVKIFRDYGKSGTHMYNIDSFAYDASNHGLADLAKEELKKKCTQVHRIFLVSLELFGGVDTIFIVVLFVLHVIIVFKTHRDVNEAKRKEFIVKSHSELTKTS
ncbi:complement decay-accelerating factor [Orycteropus afer afer]|uniref:Complement decay-accelerating factor n=1 Tax=Orycteropus afer afer TaxID=1230840 RepID=A0A8B7AVJ3_ORYAF|nr:complement decay-accelerating factor [Orycteropus afer afer]